MDEGNPSNFDLEDKNPKRRMKTPFQLEALERLYAEDRYPTEAVRAELSLHLNLSDKQLQMWFCHRRLKDRKYRVDEFPPSLKRQRTQPCVSDVEVWQPPNLDSGIGENDSLDPRNVRREGVEMKDQQRPFCSTHGAREGDNLKTERSDALLRLWKSAVVSANPAFGLMESHLDDQVCDDGPILGVEFDTLPSGAFGSAIGEQVDERAQTTALHLLPPESAVEDEYPGNCSQKVGMVGISLCSTVGLNCKRYVERSIADEPYLNMVERLPEQLIAKEDGHRGTLPLNSDANPDKSNETVNSCSSVGALLPSDAQVYSRDLHGPINNVDESISRSFFPSIECRKGLCGRSGLGLDDDYQQRFCGYRTQGQVGICHSEFRMKLDGQLSAVFPRLASVEGPEGSGTPCKAGNVKVIEESEALVQRVRREFERQEVVKRKREVQKRRELEKQDRDKRKEEERAAKERQREEERIQREQRREIERQERRALKESKRMEKQQQREELRRAKEAAKLKTASEKAAAKRVTRELMDKIEDDELELLERAIPQESSRSHRIDNHHILGPEDTSKELLATFPPSAVKMSTPLTFCMFRDGLEHVLGHLFMVWRFLTTFADVIGLWPFTLDEFERALHDFDSRLLSEIHVSLIKVMVKNIEDAARASATGSVGSQNGFSLVAGGHPQILEAAAEWGFNVSEWGQHVNSITWPDILRQFALAAGYGPKWKRGDNGPENAVNVAQVKGESVNTVTSLRSGAAAANAVAQMLGRGVRHVRKCRYRLTPGTVKYAAFHVLSLEGEKGSTISEVAEKIQKSGLRDLRTSKTPEASIAAALSRDVNLFERVAPSTYCVRSAFRKDASDRVEVLQSAKDRIQLFQSGFLDGDDADNIAEEVDDMEKDSDYDSDGQDVENGAAASPSGKKDVDGNDEMQIEDACLGKVMNDTTEMVAIHKGEAWVQGLMEGDYSDLSIEERLMALVALVSVVNEGNSVRIALETRMEAAGTLKRQLWAEAQLEKRRQKEGQITRLQSSMVLDRKCESCSPTNMMAKKSPIVSATEDKPNEFHVCTESLENEVAGGADNFVSNTLPAARELQTGSQWCSNSCLQGDRSRPDAKVGVGTSAEELYVIRSVPLGLDRRRNRYWQFICGDGQDPGYGRIYFESSVDGRWEVIDSEEALDAFMLSLDIRGTREAGLHTALLQVEAVLRQSMERAAMTQSPPDLIFPARSCCNTQEFEVSEFLHTNSRAVRALAEQTCQSLDFETDEKILPKSHSLFESLKDFGRWIWIDTLHMFFASRSSKSRKLESSLLPICVKCGNMYEAIGRHCHVCYPTPSKCSAKLSMASNKKSSWWDVPPRLHVLKAQIMAIEVAIPSEALKNDWEPHYRKSWTSFVKSAMTATELFQALLSLEREMETGWLSGYVSEVSSNMYGILSATDDFDDAPWIPRTSAAVGLRAMAFDAALSRCPELKRRHVREERMVRHSS